MATEIRFQLDECVQAAVAEGLLRRGIDVTMPDSVHLVGASDEAHLAFALADDRVIVTHDSDFSVLHARGFAHAGIMFCHPTKYSVGELIVALVLLHQCLTAEEMRNHLEYL